MFEATGALDPILDVDTRLFIDPSLLRISTVPELSESYSNVVAHFEDVLKIVGHIGKVGDRMWRRADELLVQPSRIVLLLQYRLLWVLH